MYSSFSKRKEWTCVTLKLNLFSDVFLFVLPAGAYRSHRIDISSVEWFGRVQGCEM